MFQKSAAAKRVSPIKEPPLRNAGESLEEQFSRVLEKAMPWIVAPAAILVFTVIEWVSSLLNAPRQPGVLLIITVAVTALSYYKLRPLMIEGRKLRLGIRGERAVAETLDELKRDGYRVFHDLVQPGFNIDHVVIGPTGVYAIETKTRSKYADNRDVHVTYDGQHVLVDGYAPDRDPIFQAQAQADCVANLLEPAAGQRPFVRSVVVYPGWWVDPQPKGVTVWVLSPKGLLGFIRNDPRTLDGPTIARLATALEPHARASDPAQGGHRPPFGVAVAARDRRLA